jgi:hypothetical protein
VGLKTDHATLLDALIRTVFVSFVVIPFLRFRAKAPLATSVLFVARGFSTLSSPTAPH